MINTRPQSQSLCPICKKPAVTKYRPFCSKRCSDLDLGRWLNESYAVPGNTPVPVDADVDEDDDYPA